MGFRQIFGGSTAPKYLTDGVPSNIWGVYTPKRFHGRGSVKYLGGLQLPNISRKGFRQIFGGSTAPKYLTEGVPSNIWGVYSPKRFHGRGSVKYLGAQQPPNVSRKGFRQIFRGSTAPKNFIEVVPSNIWAVYSPKIFEGWGSVKYLGGLQTEGVPPNIWGTEGVPSNIWGVYSPQIFHGRGSVKYLGGLQPPNI